MKIRFTILMTFGLLPLFSLAQSPSANVNDRQDLPHPKAEETQIGPPLITKPELENEAVQVLRIIIGPHEKVPMHEISPRLIVWVSDARLRLTFPDGRTEEEEHHAGETEWLRAQKHAGENLGNTPIELIVVIPKK